MLDVSAMRNDDFNSHILKRAKHLLDAIENAIGKTISGRDSQEIIDIFGGSLV